MSSTENSTALTLNQLLELADKYLPGEHVIRDYGWDFKTSTLQHKDNLEPVPEFVCRNIEANFEPGARDILQVKDVIGRMQEVAKILNEFQRNLAVHLHWMVIRNFWIWLKESKRTQYTAGLMKSWIDVHALDEVREMKDNLLAMMESETPLKDSPNVIHIGPEVIAEMDSILTRKLHVDLQEPVVVTTLPATA